MKVLVIGSKGQVARSLVEHSRVRPNIELVAIGRPEIDLERPGSAASAIAAVAPDVVINAAAYTAVDQAEEEPARAFRINSDAVGEIAAATAGKAHLVHLSTDYVFDGTAERPYTEEARPNPVNDYGRSKLAGEDKARLANPECIIVRTSWVYGPFAANFVKTMMRAAEEHDRLRVVDDQLGCPTSSLDLASGLLRVIEVPSGELGAALSATYHLAGAGSTSWFVFAQAIMDERRKHGLKTALIEPIRSSEWQTRAKRPRNSVLNSTKFEGTFGYRMPEWRMSLAQVIGRLVSDA